MYVLTNERYKTYQKGFLFCPLGHALGVGLGGYLGAKIKFCPLCYLLLNHWTKFKPNLVCELLTWMGGRNVKFFGGPGEGSKGQIYFNFNNKVNFKDFYSKLCVCSHKWKIQNISDGIFILSPGSYPRGGTLGSKLFFFQTWSCGISNRQGWQAKQNASNNSILGSNWWPWSKVKR